MKNIWMLFILGAGILTVSCSAEKKEILIGQSQEIVQEQAAESEEDSDDGEESGCPREDSTCNAACMRKSDIEAEILEHRLGKAELQYRREGSLLWQNELPRHHGLYEDNKNTGQEESDSCKQNDRYGIRRCDSEHLVAYLDCRSSTSPQEAAEHSQQEDNRELRHLILVHPRTSL